MEGGEETLVLNKLAAWGLTGEGIYFYNYAANTVEFYSFATHRITQIAKTEKPPYRSLAVSPDGRWILLDQVDLNTGKIMVVENFRW